MTTTTLPAPRRITTFQYLRASIAERLGLEPEHEGADAIGWVEQLRQMRLADDRERLDLYRAAGRVEQLAIAAVPHREVHDPHLGVLYIAGQEPARLFDGDRYHALIGVAA